MAVYLLRKLINTKKSVKINNEWVSPKTILGNVATGEYYYPRISIVKDIWEELTKGNSILLAAPRRVGKTSIMRDLEQNPRNGYLVKFESIQGVKSIEDFYKTLYNIILSCLGTSDKVKSWFTKYIKSKKITEFGMDGLIKLGENDFDYLNEINTIFKDLNDGEETVILLLDELPEVLHKLHKNEKTEDAQSILKQLRTWRQSNFKKLQFVLAGSIGIHYVVKAIEGRTADLNDLNKIICDPLSKQQALDFIEWATKEATIQYDDELKNYLLQKIAFYYTPYFINLMLDTIDNIGRKNESPNSSKSYIDEAFNIVVAKNEHFADWKNRLKEYMPKEDFEFVNDLLIHIAHEGSINIHNVYDKAVRKQKEEDYMSLIDDLTQDGYLVEEPAGSKKYVFISPFLKAFWLRNNPVYNGK